MSNNLIVTRKSEVPEYLQQGDFYKSLNDEDDERISVPADTLKPNTIVESNDDLQHLLSSLRFWAVGKVVTEVVRFCLNKTSTSCDVVLENFSNDFRFVEIVLQMIPLTKSERVKLAINSGILELVTSLRGASYALQVGCH